MITPVLLALAVVVAVVALRRLPGASWVYRAPSLGIAAWYAVLLTVLVATGAALLELFLRWPGGWRELCAGRSWCDQIGVEHGPVAWIGIRVVAVLVLVALVHAAARVLRGTRTIARLRRRHRDMVQLAGRRDAELNATVIEHPLPAAYLLPGAAGSAVVTSGAVDRLGAEELAAVLAHERAHATGHHQSLLDIVEVATVVLPWLPIVATARAQVQRLVEMRADEVAAKSHPPVLLARALVAMTSGPAPVPGGVAAATGGDTLERLHRLMRPPARLTRATRSAIAAAVLLLPFIPLVLAATGRWLPFLSISLWDL